MKNRIRKKVELIRQCGANPSDNLSILDLQIYEMSSVSDFQYDYDDLLPNEDGLYSNDNQEDIENQMNIENQMYVEHREQENASNETSLENMDNSCHILVAETSEELDDYSYDQIIEEDEPIEYAEDSTVAETTSTTCPPSVQRINQRFGNERVQLKAPRTLASKSQQSNKFVYVAKEGAPQKLTTVPRSESFNYASEENDGSEQYAANEETDEYFLQNIFRDEEADDETVEILKAIERTSSVSKPSDRRRIQAEDLDESLLNDNPEDSDVTNIIHRPSSTNRPSTTIRPSSMYRPPSVHANNQRNGERFQLKAPQKSASKSRQPNKFVDAAKVKYLKKGFKNIISILFAD